jgi:5'-deoxynucleotidase YfbR-like HD superfamily hydrolase
MNQLKVRGMRFVNRWGNSPRIKENNVAEHSFFVAYYVKEMCKRLPIDDNDLGNILSLALDHDLHESIMVDIPTNVKRKVNISCNEIEEEAKIIKLADLLDALLTCQEEIQMGNHFFICARDEIKPVFISVFNDLIKDIKSEYRTEPIKSWVSEILVGAGIGNPFDLEYEKQQPDLESMTHIHKGYIK